jgi:hypothetical protein
MKSWVLLSMLLPAAGVSAALVVGRGTAAPARDAASASRPRTSYRVTFGHASDGCRDLSANLAHHARTASDFLRAEEGLEFATIDDDRRFEPTERPERPEAQHPPVSTPENVDTGKPVHDWQRATDDWFGLRPKGRLQSRRFRLG